MWTREHVNYCVILSQKNDLLFNKKLTFMHRRIRKKETFLSKQLIFFFILPHTNKTLVLHFFQVSPTHFIMFLIPSAARSGSWGSWPTSRPTIWRAVSGMMIHISVSSLRWRWSTWGGRGTIATTPRVKNKNEERESINQALVVPVTIIGASRSPRRTTTIPHASSCTSIGGASRDRRGSSLRSLRLATYISISMI